MALKPYTIKYVWNGKKSQVAFYEMYETEEQWEEAMLDTGLDIIDVTGHTAYIDWGDCDD